jgi:hypothetical protein
LQRFAWFSAVALILACDGAASDAKHLELAIGDGSEIVVDLGCTQDCARAMVHMNYVAPHRPDDAVLEFSQYRIDYAIGGAVGSVPYYAGALDVRIRPGGMVEVELPIAGLRQRVFLSADLAAGEKVGTATITIAGYDVLDEVAIVEADFDIRFSAVDEGGSHAP